MPFRVSGHWRVVGQQHGRDLRQTDARDNVHFGTPQRKNLSNLLLCSSVNYTSCGTGYSKGNRVIKLQVHPGETIHVGVYMKDRDWGGSDDEVCTNAVNLGPFTDAQLQYINEPHSL